TPIKKQMVQLSPTMPAINPDHFHGSAFSAYELETATFTSFPEVVPIGPMWAACSVIYGAFGSFTLLEKVEVAISRDGRSDKNLSNFIKWIHDKDTLPEDHLARTETNMNNIHVLMIPYPAQGHVIPLMELARCFTSNGLKVTFVNTEVAHKMVTSALSEKDGDGSSDLMQMVCIPDGMEPLADRNDLGNLTKVMSQVMPGKLEELIKGINKTDDQKITCIIADYCMGWVIRVAKKLGIRFATFCSGSAALLSLTLSLEKLLDDEIIDSNGVPLKDQMVQLSTTMPSMDPAKFTWACIGDSDLNKIIFDITVLDGKEAAEAADRIICNSTMELEPGAFTLFPKMLPIGPLLATNKSTKQTGHFWNVDTTCLTWLDKQPVGSVIYVAFGSYTIFDQAQFEELALGLELTNKPFLWVVRPVIVAGTLSWKVSAMAFHSCAGHTLPISFLIQLTREEIKSKLEQLISNNIVKENALNLKIKVMDCVRDGNSSNKNLSNFIGWIKEGNSEQTKTEVVEPEDNSGYRYIQLYKAWRYTRNKKSRHKGSLMALVSFSTSKTAIKITLLEELTMSMKLKPAGPLLLQSSLILSNK
ncbi:hypothetical protein Tco_0783350, partial [Tanacetum coccineum]